MIDIVNITTGVIFISVVFKILYIVKNENNGEWDNYDTSNIILDICILLMGIKFIWSFTDRIKDTEINESLNEAIRAQTEAIGDLTRAQTEALTEAIGALTTAQTEALTEAITSAIGAQTEAITEAITSAIGSQTGSITNITGELENMGNRVRTELRSIVSNG